MALGPFDVHAHEHLDPVLRLHPTLAYRDRHYGVVIRIWVGEEQVELSRAELGRDRRLLLRHLFGQVWIAGGELVKLDQVAGPFFQLLPGLDELPVLGRFPGRSTRATRIVPDPGLGQEVVELLGALELGGQVKDAPSAGESVPTALWDSVVRPPIFRGPSSISYPTHTSKDPCRPAYRPLPRPRPPQPPRAPRVAASERRCGQPCARHPDRCGRPPPPLAP